MKAIKKGEVSGGNKIKLNEVLNWLEGLRVKEAPYGTYKMSVSTEATLFSSCFTVFVRELYNDLKNITLEQKMEWIKYLFKIFWCCHGKLMDSKYQWHNLTEYTGVFGKRSIIYDNGATEISG